MRIAPYRCFDCKINVYFMYDYRDFRSIFFSSFKPCQLSWKVTRRFLDDCDAGSQKKLPINFFLLSNAHNTTNFLRFLLSSTTAANTTVTSMIIISSSSSLRFSSSTTLGYKIFGELIKKKFITEFTIINI